MSAPHLPREFRPKPLTSLRMLVAQSLALEQCSLGGDGAMLLRGQTYLVHCGSISLPADHRGLLSPKSSIGTDNRLF